MRTVAVAGAGLVVCCAVHAGLLAVAAGVVGGWQLGLAVFMAMAVLVVGSAVVRRTSRADRC